MNKDWKYEAKRRDVTDLVFDLFYDTSDFLKKNKHIQDIQNFFKKFTRAKYKEKSGYIKLNSSNIFEEIKINEIKEIKLEKEIKIFDRKSKSKKIITEQTEPTIQQVMDALTVNIDYRKMIVDTIVNSIMFIVIIFVGFFEGVQYLFKRLIEGIEYLSTLPYKQMFNVLFRISTVIVAIGLSFYLYNYFQSVSTAQKMSDERINTLQKEINDYDMRLINLQQAFNDLKANSVIVEHKIVSKEYLDRNGQIKRVEKIR